LRQKVNPLTFMRRPSGPTSTQEAPDRENDAADAPPDAPSVDEQRSLSVLPKDDPAVRKRPLQPEQTVGPPQIITACHQRPPHSAKSTDLRPVTAVECAIPDLHDKRGFPEKDGRFCLASDAMLRH